MTNGHKNLRNGTLPHWASKKHALITGASSGIGGELARDLVGVCRKLTLVSRNREGRLDRVIERLEKLIPGRGPVKTKIEPCVLDVCDYSGASDLVRRIYKEDGDQVDIFINCAGGSHIYGTLESMSHEDIGTIFDTNAKAPIFWLRELLPHMKRNKMKAIDRKRAHVVLLSSRSGERALPKLGVYAAAKGAVEKLAEAMQKEYCRYRIVFTLVNPGSINTAFTADWDARARNAHNAESMEVSEAVQPILQALDSQFVINKVSYESVKQWLNEPGVLNE